jgi:demethylmenaquinone methyltransferase/2-methoxy-6-polyprenyl-1,4-benzoquinol methylase
MCSSGGFVWSDAEGGKMAEHQEWDRERAEQHARWAKMASRLIYAPFARRIVGSLASLEKDSTIVDLGIGPGILSIELHKLLPQAKIIGVDLSSDMLEIAKINADEAGMSSYETRLGRAEEIAIESNSANLVVTQSSFHEWEDPQKGLSEIFRVLKPGGSLILKDYNRAWLSGWRRSLLKFLLTMVGESYEDHVSMFKFTFDEVADLLREAGFDEIKGKKNGLQFFVQALKQ